MSEARIVLEKFDTFGEYLRDARTVLELGGGQGWVSCMIAHEFPGAQVIASDIATDAVRSLPEWERILKVSLPGGLTCKSYEVPVRAQSIDVVLTFAAAHHFGRHRRTLQELKRILAPSGRVLYLHEPACRKFLYDPAVARVNRKRPVVTEDVLRYREVERIAADCGLRARVIHSPTTTYRRPVETIYYLVLQRIAPLRTLLPCSVDIVFEHA
jgi:SAM-dependent methyltransferase